jgi:hypothetical protein
MHISVLSIGKKRCSPHLESRFLKRDAGSSIKTHKMVVLRIQGRCKVFRQQCLRQRLLSCSQPSTGCINCSEVWQTLLPFPRAYPAQLRMGASEQSACLQSFFDCACTETFLCNCRTVLCTHHCAATLVTAACVASGGYHFASKASICITPHFCCAPVSTCCVRNMGKVPILETLEYAGTWILLRMHVFAGGFPGCLMTSQPMVRRNCRFLGQLHGHAMLCAECPVVQHYWHTRAIGIYSEVLLREGWRMHMQLPCQMQSV